MSNNMSTIKIKYYEIVEQMGKGAFGEVYKAKKLQEPERGKMVAIKFEAQNAETKCLEREKLVSTSIPSLSRCRFPYCQ